MNSAATKRHLVVILNQTVGPTTIDVANWLVENQTDVDVYCGSVHPTTSLFHEQVKVRNCSAYQKHSNFRRLWTWLLYWFQCTIRLLIRRGTFTLLVISNPPFNLWTGFLLRKLKGIRYCALIFDVYPDALTAYDHLSAPNWINRLWIRLNKLAMASAETVFTLSESMRQRLLRQWDKGTSILVVESWCDTDHIRPVPKDENEFLIAHGLTEKRIVLYSGNFGRTHDLTSILACARTLQRNEEIHFILIGGGEQFATVADSASCLTNVLVLPFQPTDVFVHSVACGDIALVTLHEAAASLSVPSRTYNFLASGTPIVAIAPEESALAKTVLESSAGEVVAAGDPETLATTIESILYSPERREAYSTAARQASLRYTKENAQLICQRLMPQA